MLFNVSINHPQIICCIYYPDHICICTNILFRQPVNIQKIILQPNQSWSEKCHIRATEQVIVNNTLSFSKFSVEREMNDSSLVTLVFTLLNHRR